MASTNHSFSLYTLYTLVRPSSRNKFDQKLPLIHCLPFKEPCYFNLEDLFFENINSDHELCVLVNTSVLLLYSPPINNRECWYEMCTEASNHIAIYSHSLECCHPKLPTSVDWHTEVPYCPYTCEGTPYPSHRNNLQDG